MSQPPALILDVDGVIIEGFPRKRWDAELEADLGVRPKVLQQQFFKPHWKDVLIGRMPVEQPLQAFLDNHQIDISVADFLAYWHGKDAHLREDVIESAAAWKSRTGGVIGIATNQDLTRANYLRETLGLANHFDFSIVSCEIGALKPEADFFQHADTMLGRTNGQSVTFLDDLIDNVEGAVRHGWQAHQVANPDEALALIDSLDL